tara:strand:- start:126 stop:1100 length:975 start_codon:yes stop_codon:yes gene_type:complete
MKTCFIGGTGRCGTSILRTILSRHSRVATLPIEHRLTVDPDGIFDFYRSYTTGWSPYYADARLTRLKNFLEELSSTNPVHKIFRYLFRAIRLAGFSITPKKYLDVELSHFIPNYSEHVNTLLNELVEFEYTGERLGTGSYSFNNKIQYAPNYSKEQLKKIFQNFIHSFIQDILTHNHKDCFIEDNTWNILFSADLLDLIPNAKIISVIRDPRDVVASLSKQKWMPSNKVQSSKIYNDLIVEWIEIRRNLDKQSWIEVRLEDVVLEPESQIRKICDFIELPWEDNLLEIDLSKSNSGRWKKDFSVEEQRLVIPLLAEHIKSFGYE